MVVGLLLHKRRDGKDWETLVRGQVETEWGSWECGYPCGECCILCSQGE